MTEVACEGEHTIDWLLHLSGEVSHNGEAAPAAALGDALGYEHFSNVRKIACGGEFVIRAGELTVTIASDGEIYLADSPGNPANIMRTAVIVRTVGAAAKVRAAYSIAQ